MARSMRASLVERGPWSGRTVATTRVDGKMECDTEKAIWSGLMVANTMAAGKRMIRMEKDKWNGLMDSFIAAILNTESAAEKGK